jgi:hypothetical protein
MGRDCSLEDFGPGKFNCTYSYLDFDFQLRDLRLDPPLMDLRENYILNSSPPRCNAQGPRVICTRDHVCNVCSFVKSKFPVGQASARLASENGRLPRTINVSLPPTFTLFLLLLHTYLLEAMALTNAYCCDTSPSLHIEAARIVGFPSGTPSGEFLIALPLGHPFH